MTPTDAARAGELPATPPLSGEVPVVPPTSTGEERVAEAPAPEAPPPVVPPAPVEAAAVAALPPSDVYFDFDRADVGKGARGTLKEQITRLRGDKKLKLTIEGHCDERGTRDYNLLLGERRARAIKRTLEQMGVPPARMSTTSYGKERPFCTQHSDACWRQNRRVHLTVQ